MGCCLCEPRSSEEAGYRLSADEECPGAGKCHGCMAWCNECGDVSATCDSPTCQRHHCNRCHQQLTIGEVDQSYERSNDSSIVTCVVCFRAEVEEEERYVFERAIDRGDFDIADKISEAVKCAS